ncbi:hypothetical protein [Streptomyces sp. NPDC002685]|uniref:hypothetical protein n=1 Tax=Streptomyces sp. NPDC002685 TaxID=3154540 RepID=UPI00331EC9E6
MSTNRPFRSVRLRASATAGGLAAALALAGCTGAQGSSERPAPEPSSARASASASSPGESQSPASDRSEDLPPGESVTKAPAIPDSTVVTKVANAHGNAEIDVPGGIGPGPLSIAVNCQGRGTLNVSVEPTGLSFPLTCAAGKVSGVLNRLDLGHDHDHATVTVTAPSGIRWALAVGH